MTQLIGLPKSRLIKWSALAFSTLLATALVAACSSSSASDDDDDNDDNDSTPASTGGKANTTTSTGGASASGGTGSTTGGTSGSVNTNVTACPGVAYNESGDPEGQCTGAGSEAEPSPLDLMMLMDRTQSMTYEVAPGMQRWEALRAAVGQFVTDPQSQQIRVGVQFFSLTGNLDLVADCDPNAYVPPAVEIGPLSQTGAPILAAMDALVLGGQTPSAPALQGVIWHAQDWQRTNLPGRKTAVLVITDGLPTQCPQAGETEPSVDDIVAVTQAGAADATTPISTYVIGVSMGANKFNLNRIAAGGGTREAYLTGDSGDTTAALVTALNNITSDPLACEYKLPPSPDPLQALDTARVRVVHFDGAGNAEEIPYATSRGGCSAKNGGWYYDDVEKPGKILVCPCTCANFRAGSVVVQIGCKPAPVSLG